MSVKPLVYWLSAHLHCNQKAKTSPYNQVFFSINSILFDTCH